VCLDPTTAFINIVAVSLLADTGDALEKNCRELSKPITDESSEHITLMATLSHHTYQSLPKRMTYHLHQWVDYIALITSLKADGDDDSTMWELIIKASTVFDSVDSDKSSGSSFMFKIHHYYDTNHELCQEIVWDM
jgi:hypothetical protein